MTRKRTFEQQMDLVFEKHWQKYVNQLRHATKREGFTKHLFGEYPDLLVTTSPQYRITKKIARLCFAYGAWFEQCEVLRIRKVRSREATG